ncbi:Alpha/Beta hydrolase protein [Pterulicium gracile]|uniref:Alpha/Beta hydrolase protein n=1 Tax=Pterulicium gracile TaxID=1884261 RepID=A0A5C3Q6B2_9AGAR|nr:Alpha/Beta hydrolase protein [Pterula gracilis]
MPLQKVVTSAGTIEMNYQICTPTNACATAIDQNLPTILFLHPVYLSSIAFHNQMNDASIRRFNCVSFDAREHGLTISKVDKNYGPAQAAEDTVLLLDALGINKVHMFAVSMGTLTAMHMTMTYPERCSSAYLLSPHAIREPEDVMKGRREIVECWEEGFSRPESRRDAVYGALQLAFSNKPTSLGNTMLSVDISRTLKIYDPSNKEEVRIFSLSFFEADRDKYSCEGFSGVKCPVKLMFCVEDVAYTLEQARELLKLMQDSGVNASLEQIMACHYGHITKPTEVNQSLVKFLQEVDPCTAQLRVPSQAVSPFDSVLKKAGYVEVESDCGDVQPPFHQFCHCPPLNRQGVQNESDL